MERRSLMRKWYIQSKTSLIGPVNEKQAEILARNGRLKSLNWVCEVDSSDWNTAQDVEAFTDFFHLQQLDLLGDEDIDDTWVLLQEKVDEAGQKIYEQCGPFKTREILSKLARGETAFEDRVWQQGFLDWKRIGEVDCFLPISFEEIEPELSEQLSEEVQNDTKSREMDFAISEKKKHIDLFKSEEKPKEAGEDLLKDPYEFRLKEMELERKKKEGLDEYVSFKSRRRFGPRKRSFSMPKKSKKFYGVISFIGLLITVIFVRNYSLKQNQKQQLQAIAKKQIVDQWQQGPQLKLSYMSQDNGGVLKFITNHRHSDKLKIKLIGKKGQILKVENIEKVKQYELLANKELVIDVSNWSLPRGYYELSAKYSDMVVNKKIFIGKKDSTFYQELQQHQRKLAQKKDREYSLVKIAAGKLRRQAERLESGFKNSRRNPLAWSNFYKRWRKNQHRVQKSQQILVGTANTEFALKEEVKDLKERNKILWRTAKAMNSHIINPRKPVPKLKSLRKIASDLRRVESAKLKR